MTSLTVKDATLVSPAGRTRATVHCSEGVIQALLPPGDAPSADRVIDAKGAYVIPGAIDGHVHLGVILPFADSCREESAAAVTGGVTTMWHYLLSGGSFKDTHAQHVADIEEHSIVDQGFHGLVTNAQQVWEIPETVDELRLTSYKFHMAMKGPEAGYGIVGLDDGLIFEGMRQVATRPGVMALIHAENIDVILHNDPYRGGTHLPDLTMVSPIFCDGELVAFAANRAHHADVGADRDRGQPAAPEDAEIGLVVGAVLALESLGVKVEGVGVLHGELPHPQHSRLGPGLVAELGLDLVPDLG